MSTTTSITLPRTTSSISLPSIGGRGGRSGIIRFAKATIAFLNDNSTGRTTGQGVVSGAFPTVVSATLGGRTAGHALVARETSDRLATDRRLTGHAHAVRDFSASASAAATTADGRTTGHGVARA
jgi:hypothetical protein